jgi:anionic cell wall polymer biosynthesis LytR-Cps2A-Psr (LCP) family protein
VYAAGHPTVTAVNYVGKLLDQRREGRHKITSLGEDSKNSEVFTIAAMGHDPGRRSGGNSDQGAGHTDAHKGDSMIAANQFLRAQPGPGRPP